MITGIILAGGKSLRMGQPKPFIEFKGKILIRYSLDLLKSICSETLIVAKDPKPYISLGATVVTDMHESASPMVGIYAGLSKASYDWTILLACDCPFVRKELIEGLIKKLKESPNLRAVIPLAPEIPGGKPIRQVLIAAYNKSVLPHLEKKISEGRFSLMRELSEPEACFVNWKELDPQDPNASSFININTPDDFQKFTERTI